MNVNHAALTRVVQPTLRAIAKAAANAPGLMARGTTVTVGREAMIREYGSPESPAKPHVIRAVMEGVGRVV